MCLIYSLGSFRKSQEVRALNFDPSGVNISCEQNLGYNSPHQSIIGLKTETFNLIDSHKCDLKPFFQTLLGSIIAGDSHNLLLYLYVRFPDKSGSRTYFAFLKLWVCFLFCATVRGIGTQIAKHRIQFLFLSSNTFFWKQFISWEISYYHHGNIISLF